MTHGMANVTAEAIADAVDVSPRTFHNYFSSKEEAIVSLVGDSAAQLIRGFRQRPAEEPVWVALENATVEVAAKSGAGNDPKTVQQLIFIRENVPVLAHELAMMKETVDELARIVAERTGTDPHSDLYPNLQAAAAMLGTRSAVDIWLADPARTDLVQLIRQAFEQMRTGLPQPASQNGTDEDVHP